MTIAHTVLTALVLFILPLSGSQQADAQTKDKSALQLTVSFGKVVDSCKGAGHSLPTSKITFSIEEKDIRITIPSLPAFKGKIRKRGRMQATATSKEGDSNKEVRYKFSGKASSKSIQAVLVAEFFENEKPSCTQSWNLKTK